jgi:NhaP-type Na+/H+ or K+/H+ antiporter
LLELSAILILGIGAQWFAWKSGLPAILPLIVIGLIVGPFASSELLFGYKLIDPDRIFEGNMLHYFVSLSVGVILFEGGLTLKLKEVKNVAFTVRNLIIVGPVISLVGGGLAAHYFLDIDIRIALLFGALIIVTGPTVIGPILRNVRLNQKVATILKWESIIIDPIGALVAVLMYEFIVAGNPGAQFTITVLITFLKTVIGGAFIGAASAWFLYYFLKRKWIPKYLINVFSLAIVFVCFVAADMFASESGLLSVTLMGMILANMRIKEVEEILSFKESLVLLLISILFIILSANIQLSQLQMLGWGSALVFMVVILLRPLSVLISSYGSNLNFREKLYISWIGPRGIVAAAIASIFALTILEHANLTLKEVSDAELLIPLTFLIILGTVLLQGGTAKPIAKLLDVMQKDKSGILILGAHEGGRAIARYLNNLGKHVVLVDTSHHNINEAKMMNLRILEKNILEANLSDMIELSDIGYFLTLTSNSELNIFACRKFRKDFGTKTSYRLISMNEIKFTSLVRPKDILFSQTADFYALLNQARKYPYLNEIKVESKEEFDKICADSENTIIPVFLRDEENNVQIILADHEVEFEKEHFLAYIGERIELS